MPDLFNGDPRVLDPPPTFDREAWMAKHRDPESWISALDSVVASLKESGVTRIGTTGYCFGAPPAFHLAMNGESDVTVLAHPSRLVCPEDFEVIFHTLHGDNNILTRKNDLEIQGRVESSAFDQ